MEFGPKCNKGVQEDVGIAQHWNRRLLAAGVVTMSVSLATVSGSGRALSAASSVCATQPSGARVPGTLVAGSRFRSVSVDTSTRHAFVLVAGDYAPVNRHICTTSVLTLEAGTGQLLFRTPIGAGTGPETARALANHGPSHRLFALDADYVAPGHPAHPSVAIVDTRTGRLIKSLHLVGNPDAIAVDVHTYRAFVTVNANLPVPQAHVAIIAVTRGVVLRTIPLSAQDVVVDQRRNHVFLLESGLVTMLDGATGQVLNKARLPGGYHQYNGGGVDKRTGRLFVSQLGLAPPHSGNPGNPPNTLSLINTGTGALVRTLLATQTLLLGNAVVDEPEGIVLTWPNNTDSTAASVLDARDGNLQARVTLGLPRGGFQGPTVVDQRTGDIYGYTYQGIRAIEPGRWETSTVVSSRAVIAGSGLAVSRLTGVVFGTQSDSPTTDSAGGYCTMRVGCRVLPGK